MVGKRRNLLNYLKRCTKIQRHRRKIRIKKIIFNKKKAYALFWHGLLIKLKNKSTNRKNR